ncbi:MAG: hypothetical protein AB1560_09000, partial [Pseudomonadota bacterium]
SLLALAVKEQSLPVAKMAAEEGVGSIFFPGVDTDRSNQSNPLLQAAKIFNSKNNIRYDLEPDKRFASPEKTWELFIYSLKSGDVETALSCFTPGMRAKMSPLLMQLSPEELKKMADSFIAFNAADKEPSSDYIEYAIVRKSEGRNFAGFANFVKQLGEWKINTM